MPAASPRAVFAVVVASRQLALSSEETQAFLLYAPPHEASINPCDPERALVDGAGQPTIKQKRTTGQRCVGTSDQSAVGRVTTFHVSAAQLPIGSAGPFLGPSVAAISLGIVGTRRFDVQFGRNQAFNSAGNVAIALLRYQLCLRLSASLRPVDGPMRIR